MLATIRILVCVSHGVFETNGILWLLQKKKAGETKAECGVCALRLSWLSVSF